MANTKKEISKDQLVSLLRYGFTRTQCCEFFGCDRRTLERFIKDHFDGRTFERVKAENEVFLKAGIMSNLINLSKKNASVAIFLAKSVCGLSENTSAPPDDEAGSAFASALRKASRAIGSMDGIASVPSVGEAEKYGEEEDEE